MKKIAGLILAAGASSRFGAQKILLPWNGIPLLYHISSIVLSSSASPVVVVLGNGYEAALETIKDLPLLVVKNENWEQGQSTSLKSGISHLPKDVDAVIIFLADQPFISKDLIESIISTYQAYPFPVIAPMVAGKRANPVLFDRSTFEDLLKIQGDRGGRALFDQYPIHHIPWEDERVLLDIDSPEDLEKVIHRTKFVPEEH